MPHSFLDLDLFMAFSPGSSAGNEFACNSGDPSLIPGSRRSIGEGIGYSLQYSWVSLVVQLVRNLPAMWETWVQSLGWEVQKFPVALYAGILENFLNATLNLFSKLNLCYSLFLLSLCLVSWFLFSFPVFLD